MKVELDHGQGDRSAEPLKVVTANSKPKPPRASADGARIGRCLGCENKFVSPSVDVRVCAACKADGSEDGRDR